jgi:hypothetical protein
MAEVAVVGMFEAGAPGFEVALVEGVPDAVAITGAENEAVGAGGTVFLVTERALVLGPSPRGAWASAAFDFGSSAASAFGPFRWALAGGGSSDIAFFDPSLDGKAPSTAGKTPFRGFRAAGISGPFEILCPPLCSGFETPGTPYSFGIPCSDFEAPGYPGPSGAPWPSPRSGFEAPGVRVFRKASASASEMELEALWTGRPRTCSRAISSLLVLPICWDN